MLLREAHFSLGGRFGDPGIGATGGAEAVLDYRPLDQELPLLDRVALADWGFHGILTARGANAYRVLQNLLSHEVSGLAPGSAAPNLLLDPKGKVLGLFRLWRHTPDHVDLLVEAPCLATAKKALERYCAVGKVPLEDRGRELGLFLLTGPLAQLAVREAIGADAPALGKVVETPAGNVLGHHGLASAPGFLLAVRHDQARDAWDRLLEAARRHGGGPVGWFAVEAQRVRAGVPRFGAEATHDRLPGEAGLDAAISYQKGCFVGQEVVARIKHLGHVNRLCVRLRADRPLEAGETLTLPDGKEVGVVTSVPRGPGDAVGLAVVRREHAVEGTKLGLPGGRSAEVAGSARLEA